jgi:sortase A
MTGRPNAPKGPAARAACALLAFGVAGVFALEAAWIPIKAQVAQIMLMRAWQRTRHGDPRAKPWPWADTWPVARLEFPEHDVDLIVLAGATGSTLAFGPGHLSGTARPGEPGNCVVSAHRDTHFAFLRYVLPGEKIVMETPEGNRQLFRVTARHIVYDRDVRVLDDSGATTLTLLTCYPFDAIIPGGPLRYVVRAEPVET